MRAKISWRSILRGLSGPIGALRALRMRLLSVLVSGRPALWVASLLVTRHPPSEAARKLDVRGQKRRLFVPPPDEWDYGDDGRPSWIARGGKWAVVVSSRWIRVELPQGWPKQPVPAARLGAPPLEERDPKKLLYAAWLKDCGGDTYLEVARELRFSLDGLRGAEESAKKKANRYVRRGRGFASALGVWPWTSWVRGVPPRRSWWLDDRCRDWLLLRYVEATRRAALGPAIEAAQLAQDAIRHQLLETNAIYDRYLRSLI